VRVGYGFPKHDGHELDRDDSLAKLDDEQIAALLEDVKGKAASVTASPLQGGASPSTESNGGPVLTSLNSHPTFLGASAEEPLTPDPRLGGPLGKQVAYSYSEVTPMQQSQGGITFQPHCHPADIHFPDDHGSEGKLRHNTHTISLSHLPQSNSINRYLFVLDH
jgi:hypothetical protein